MPFSLGMVFVDMFIRPETGVVLDVISVSLIPHYFEEKGIYAYYTLYSA